MAGAREIIAHPCPHVSLVLLQRKKGGALPLGYKSNDDVSRDRDVLYERFEYEPFLRQDNDAGQLLRAVSRIVVGTAAMHHVRSTRYDIE